MSEPKWKKGDLVRHRASKQVAVVFEAPGLVRPPFGDGFIYRLDTGLDGPQISGVPEFLLEDVPPSEPIT